MTFFTTLRVGLKLEWLRLRANPASWLLGGLLVGGGLIIGLLDTTSFGINSLFDNLQLAMFLTVVSSFWGWQATAAAIQPRVREVLAARAVDEWTMQLARVAVTGCYGGLITFAAYLVLTVPRYFLFEPWSVGLRWLPVIVLAHALAASLGGLAALLCCRRPGLGVPATFGLWGAWVLLAQAVGPLWPDLFLRVLRWNNLLKDAAVEPLRGPLAVSFSLAVFATTTVGVALLRRLEHKRLAVPEQGRLQTALQLGTAFILGASLVTLGTARAAREGALVDKPSTGTVDSLVWNPSRLTLTLVSRGDRQELRGPARPTAVAPRDFETFAPYIGRHGVVLPISRVASGSYDFTVFPAAGWVLYGCSTTVSQNGVRCRGEDAAEDWLVILPEGVLATADSAARSLDPSLYEAATLYDTLVRLALSSLERPAPEILPLGGRRPLWLSEKALAGSTVFGEEPVMRRQAAYSAAVTVAANLVGVREPNEALYSTRNMRLEPNVPLALVAAVDRLLFALNVLELDPAEAAARRGEPVEVSQRLYPFYPLNDRNRPDYNRWWLATDDLIAQGVPVADLWVALRDVQDWGVETWNDLL